MKGVKLMAKKKLVKSEDDLEDDLEDELLDDDEVEIDIPKVKEKEKDVDSTDIDDTVEEEEEDFEIEEEPRFTDYKYIDLNLKRGPGESDFELMIEGQTHGFCNVFVKHLLEIKGVNMAAYKVTGIELPKIYIRLDNLNDYEIKKILYKAIESLRGEVVRVQKIFQKLV